MKKFLLIALSSAMLFATSNDEINKKLDLLLQKINQLEKKVDQKDNEINQLKLQIKKQQEAIQEENKKTQEELKKQIAIRSCKKIKVLNFSDKYHDEVIPYYDLTFTIKNTYPKKIVYLVGNLFVEDKDGVKVLQDYVKRKVDLPVNGTLTIKKTHQLNSDMEKYLKDENLENDKIYFEVIKAEFADGTNVECGIF